MRNSDQYQKNRVNRIAALLTHLHDAYVLVSNEYSKTIFIADGNLLAMLKYESDTSDKPTLLVS